MMMIMNVLGQCPAGSDLGQGDSGHCHYSGFLLTARLL